MDSTDLGCCGPTVFTVENRPHVSGLVQLKPGIIHGAFASWSLSIVFSLLLLGFVVIVDVMKMELG